jgi:phosphoglycolate phosphatase-like HAD superfamily hydrolase
MNVIFDLDGTIADTLPLCIEAFIRAIEPLVGHAITEAEIVATFGASEEGIIRRFAPDRYDEGLAGYVDWYRRLHGICPRPFEGIPELLRFLRDRGSFVGLVTGKGEPTTAITLEEFALTKYFDCVKTGSPSGIVKDLRIAEILAEFHLTKESCLYVGDTIADIASCRKAGIRIAAAAWAKTADIAALRAHHPDYVFESIADLRAFLQAECRVNGAGNRQTRPDAP